MPKRSVNHSRRYLGKWGDENAKRDKPLLWEESEKSDVDILVKFYEPIGWEFIDLKEFLGEILGKEVDLVTGRTPILPLSSLAVR